MAKEATEKEAMVGTVATLGMTRTAKEADTEKATQATATAKEAKAIKAKEQKGCRRAAKEWSQQ